MAKRTRKQNRPAKDKKARRETVRALKRQITVLTKQYDARIEELKKQRITTVPAELLVAELTSRINSRQRELEEQKDELNDEEAALEDLKLTIDDLDFAKVEVA
jgi:chromosome segregation ATPase